MYQPFDDRPGKCEGCDTPDHPSMGGPSFLELVWNSVLGLWLCNICRHGYSEWQGRTYADDSDMWNHRPVFMRKNTPVSRDEENIIRGLE